MLLYPIWSQIGHQKGRTTGCSGNIFTLSRQGINKTTIRGAGTTYGPIKVFLFTWPHEDRQQKETYCPDDMSSFPIWPY